MDLKDYITDVPDYPVKGVIFKDITTLWKDPKALKQSTDLLVDHYKDQKIDKVVAAEARGFILGAPMAYGLNAGFVPIRKPKKLPRESITATYELEYGSDTLAVHKDAIAPGEKVLIVDDLIATGGTCRAIARLVNKLKGDIIGYCFLVELEFLHGRDKIKDYDIFSLIKY
ncbi:MAG: adenine phosphoribosyltransferase [Spirochaetes bacterium]|nr:adenine phosphoribosyltransferase [Spirochaetota bacterium]